GSEKEFAPGDKRRLEVTSSGKMRWKDADREQNTNNKIQNTKADEYIQEKRKKFSEGELSKVDPQEYMDEVRGREPEKLKSFVQFYDELKNDKIRSYKNKDLAKQDYHYYVLRSLFES